MSDLLILFGAVAFAFGTPAVLLYLARGEGHGVGNSGSDGGESHDGDAESDGESPAPSTDGRTVGQYRRGRK